MIIVKQKRKGEGEKHMGRRRKRDSRAAAANRMDEVAATWASPAGWTDIGGLLDL